jgi:signal transduction histidine kinase
MSCSARVPFPQPAAEPDLSGAELALRDRVIVSGRALASGLAHDLNSPLQVLGDIAFLLREELAALTATTTATAGLDQIREATAQLETTFNRLKTISKSISQLLPAPESPDALVRLEVELRIVAELTRSQWHRDANLTIDVDPRVNVRGIPRLLLRQLVVDLVLSVARFVTERSRSGSTPSGTRRDIALRAGVAGDRVLIEVVTDAGPIEPPALVVSTHVAAVEPDHETFDYAPLLVRSGIAVMVAPGFASASLCPGSATQHALFV